MHPRVRNRISAAFTMIVALFAMPSFGQTTGAVEGLSFQGYLTDNSDNPVNGFENITVKLFDASSSGNLMWTRDYASVSVANGVFNVLLTDGTPVLSQVVFNKPLWVEVVVDSETVTPRVPLTSSPYALGLRGIRVYPEISPEHAPTIIAGFSGNRRDAFTQGSTIAGGGYVTDTNAVIGNYSFIGSGLGNRTAYASAIGGGVRNKTLAEGGFIGSGYENTTEGLRSVVAGGEQNVAGNQFSAVGGGRQNEVYGDYGTIAGGYDNQVYAPYATSPGGYQNTAGGDYSFAAGYRAHVRRDDEAGNATGDEGTFVWSDRSTTSNSFQSTGSNQFLIKAAGGVGIDTNDPASQLHVANANGAGNGLLIQAAGGDGLNFYWIADQNVTIDTYRGSDSRRLPIAFQPNGGNVGIGTTAPSEKLEVNGNVLANNVAVPSDLRYKQDVERLSGALDILSKLEGVSYSFNRTAFPEKNFEEGKHYGVIAQEVQQVLPGLVHESNEGYLSVNYNGLFPVLIEAIREQQTLIEALRQEIDDMKHERN